MSGFLKTIETVAGQTIGLIRENGQVEDCSVIDESELGAGGVVRCDWAIISTGATFATGAVGPIYDVVGEAGAWAAVSANDTLFLQPGQCLVGVFHSGTAAPWYGGAWTIVEKLDNQNLRLQRVPELATSAQIDATALITADAGDGFGVYQVATPPGGTIDTDPQVMPWVSKPGPADGNTYKLQSIGDALIWTLDP